MNGGHSGQSGWGDPDANTFPGGVAAETVTPDARLDPNYPEDDRVVGLFNCPGSKGLAGAGSKGRVQGEEKEP